MRKMMLALVLLGVAGTARPGDEPADRTDRAESAANLRRLAIALQDYYDFHGHLPPASLDSKDGTPLLSWRVALLPFLGEEDLYRQFRLDEPWDSAHNKPLLARMPAVYLCPGPEPKEKYTTWYQAVVGPGCLFGPEKEAERMRLVGVKGWSRTFLFVEGAEPVAWTRPVDLAYAPDKPLPKVGGRFPDGFHASLLDGSVHFIRRPASDKALRQLIPLEVGEWDEKAMDFLRNPR